ncbi:MAG: Asp23/Gls24 family envelope stress response protein [Oscillospiraceae bacterium]
MVKIENHLGTIDVSTDYLVNLVGNTVVNCFGVAAMSATNPKQTFIERYVKANRLDKGIHIQYKAQKLVIELHIIVSYGTNIAAIVNSIMHKVQYTVEETTGFSVSRVNVFIDGMKTE